MPQGNKDPNHNAGHSTDKCLIPQINQGVERGRKKVAKSESHKKQNEMHDVDHLSILIPTNLL